MVKFIEILGIKPGRVFNKIKDKELLTPLCRIKESGKQNTDKFCHYHEAKGHNTSE